MFKLETLYLEKLLMKDLVENDKINKITKKSQDLHL